MKLHYHIPAAPTAKVCASAGAVRDRSPPFSSYLAVLDRYLSMILFMKIVALQLSQSDVRASFSSLKFRPSDALPVRVCMRAATRWLIFGPPHTY